MPNPIIFNAHGPVVDGSNVAEKLLASNFDAGALRPFVDKNKSWVTVRNNDGKLVNRLTNNTATLLIDEWKYFDNQIIKAFREELSFVPMLMKANLNFDLPNPLGVTMLMHQNMSDAMSAQISMDAKVQNEGDTPQFAESGLPVPIISSGFDLDIRFLNSSRNSAVPLDTTNQEMCGRANAKFLENQSLFGNGNITEAQKRTLDFTDTTTLAGLRYKVGDYQIDGLFTKSTAVEYTLAYDWLLAATTGPQILSDVINMHQELVEQGYGKDAILCLPSYMKARFSEDYKSTASSSTITILDRLKMIPDLDIEFFDSMGRIVPATGGTEYLNVAMFSKRSDVVRMINGFDSRLVQWNTHGGMNFHYRVMTIMVPEYRARQDNTCGIVKGQIVRA